MAKVDLGVRGDYVDRAFRSDDEALAKKQQRLSIQAAGKLAVQAKEEFLEKRAREAAELDAIIARRPLKPPGRR